MENIKNITIIGFGQMAASVVMALEESNVAISIWVRNQASITSIKEKFPSVIVSCDAKDLLDQADFVLLAIPIPAIISFVEQYQTYFKKDCIVTDLSSVKESLIMKVGDLFKNNKIEFVGSHPMAGNEKVGYVNASKNLYDKCICFICPTFDTKQSTIDIVEEFWQEIGAYVIKVDMKLHDRIVADSSHMLHLLSGAIVRQVLADDMKDLSAKASAGGFRDMTRIASSNPSMWTEITFANKDAVLASLDDLSKEIQLLRNIIAKQEEDELYNYLLQAKELRDKWSSNYLK